jgi:hypothetical protein
MMARTEILLKSDKVDWESTKNGNQLTNELIR